MTRYRIVRGNGEQLSVKARFAFIAIIEMVQILVAIPFAIIGIQINPNPQGNPVGIEANVAFFGFVFVMYALYNLYFVHVAGIPKIGQEF